MSSIALEFLQELQKLRKLFPDKSVHKLVGKSSILKFKDIPSIKRGKKSVYVVPPQDYNRIELLDTHHYIIKNGYFYDYDKEAVTGSGADYWVVADKKSLDRLFKKSSKSDKESVKKSIRSTRKSIRNSIRNSVRKSERKGVRKSVRKGVRKSARKSTRKSARKSARKNERKGVRKSVRKSVLRKK
jgi:hypothetical protein